MKIHIELISSLCVILLAVSTACCGAETQSGDTAQPGKNRDTKPQFIYLDPQKMVKVHIQKKWVEIPAVSHISGGMIELALGSVYAPNCRSHESLFLTWARPSLVHAGLQVIGLKPGKPVKFDGQSKLPSGDGLYIYVVWKEKKENKDELKYSRLEKCIYNNLVQEPVTDIKWIFTGSQLTKQAVEPEKKEDTTDTESKDEKKPKMKVVYEADVDGTIIATWHWSVTVIDISLPEGANDEALQAYHKTMPKIDTPVRIVFSPSEISEKKMIQEYASQAFVLPEEEQKKLEEEKEKEKKKKEKSEIESILGPDFESL